MVVVDGAHDIRVAKRRQPPYSSGGTLQLFTEAPSILAGTPARDKREVILKLAPAPTPSPSDDRRRWATLIVVCFAQLMIVLDVTIVNVALPSIQHDLGFSQANLTWVVNAFLVTFGSLLLLAGRLGDLARAQARVPGRPRRRSRSRRCCAASPQPGRADRRPPAAGRRRRRAGVGDPGDHRHRVPGGRGARPGDGRVRVRLGGRRLARAARRRAADRGAELALGVLRQPPDRRRDVRGRAA